MLFVYHSNRLERLLLQLHQVLAAAPLADPFVAEQIVVQNPGMGRWLAQQLAAVDGVAAHLDFPLPAAFIWQVVRAWTPTLPEQSAFERDALAWRVFGLLPGRLHEPAFAELAGYLAAEADAAVPGLDPEASGARAARVAAAGTDGAGESDQRVLKRWQLARRISDVFDQYLVYRPDLILAWEAGTGDDWQARLWRDLVAAIGGNHRARLLTDLAGAIAAGQPPVAPALLPARVALFGLSALPPLYCSLLGRLAERCDCHLFLLNPCLEYWADIVDERGQARRRARALATGQPDPTTLLDLGNPLLAAFGHTGQNFLDQVLELGGETDDLFIAPDGEHLLARLQRDVLTLTDPRRADPAQRPLLAADDGSLLVHRCHGPLREVQVLHDRLLAEFERASVAGVPLAPRDCLIMAPDIDVYAPFIEAVFGAAPAGRYLPWSIADRRLGAGQPVLGAFRELLALPRSRLTASELLGWLAVPAIGRRFAIDAAALARIRTWVDETGIRWGLDAGMRAGLGLPADPANTWSFGLRRLFAGLMLPPDSGLYGDCLPYSDLAASEGPLLGQLQSCVERLSYWRGELARAHPAADWRHLLTRLLDDLFAPEADEEALLQGLREAIDDLAWQASATGIEAPLPPTLIEAELAALLERSAAGHRFLSGQISFCNLVPMRSIPARFIGLLGLDGTAFPRTQHPLGFDLIARQPRRGDRSRRQDDRYLFLEALLSARGHLHLSYTGRDQRDNTLKVPSVVLAELLDCIDRSYRWPTGAAPLPSQHLVIEQPLQPFSPRCFDAGDPHRWSYAAEWLPTSGDAGTAPPAFSGGPLAEPSAPGALAQPQEAMPRLELADLIRCLRAPAAWFLEQRLGLRLPMPIAELADREPFSVDGLDRWSLAQELLRLAGGDELGDLPGDALDQAEAWLRGAGRLPQGAAGSLVCARETGRVRGFLGHLNRLSSPAMEPVEVDLALPCAGVRLVGWLTGVSADGLLEHRLGRCRAVDLLALWVRHLALNAMAPAGVELASRFLSEAQGEATVQRLAPVAAPDAHLDDLAMLFQQAQRAPLPLFPQCSYTWAATEDMGKVCTAWVGGWGGGPPGEGEQAAVRSAFRGQPEPLDQAFRDLAEQVFAPLLAALD